MRRTARGDGERVVRVGIGLGFTAISVTLLALAVDWGRFFSILGSANLWWIGLAVVLLLGSVAAKAARWRLLLPGGAGISTPRLFRILSISYLFNNVLPLRAGDVARVAITTRLPGMRVMHVVSSMVTERVLDGAMLILAFLAVSLFLPLNEQSRDRLNWVLFFMGVAVALGALLVVSRGGFRWIAQREAFRSRFSPTEWVRAQAASFAEGWRQLYHAQHATRIWGLSAATWLLAFAINYLLMRALGIDAPFTVAVLITCTTNLAMIVPSSPGYIGVFHAAATLTLLPFGVGSSLAFSFAVLAHLVNVLPVSLLGSAFLLYGRETVRLQWRTPQDSVVE